MRVAHVIAAQRPGLPLADTIRPRTSVPAVMRARLPLPRPTSLEILRTTRAPWKNALVDS